MDNQEDTLLDSLKQYETQLAQIRQAINSTPNSDDKNDLYTLEKDIEELISLTKETLSSLKQTPTDNSGSTSKTEADEFSQEYALFKAELAELEGNSGENSNLQTDEFNDSTNETDIPLEIQEDLNALKGSKCQAPHKQHWGDESYHNALIVDIETKEKVADLNHIQVRVLFVNPTEKDMLPCPYYLDGECRFTDAKCHYSHGELVPLPSIREYREPDFSSIRDGSQVLAKQKDNLWHRAKVKEVLNNSRCVVKFESKGCETVELDLHDLLPLDSEGTEDESCSSSSSDDDDVVPQEYFVQLSLLKNPPSTALGAWEKHTKGIGSRLMANMGYVVGCGLGKFGEGRLEPVEATAYPPGKSLDACMALREAAGGDANMFKAEQRQKKQARQLLKQQQRLAMKERNQVNLFSFINTKLAGHVSSNPDSSSQTKLASSSRKGLNVERFRLGENIKKIQKDIEKYNQSLKRHEVGSVTYNTLSSKLGEAQSELLRLQNSDKLVAREQDQRDGRKKMAVF